MLGVAALALYSVIAVQVFSAKPLLIDEIIQVWQARVMAGGRLWVPVPEHAEFSSAMHLVDYEGRRFGQFPLGGPAMLMLGSLAGAEWLVGPVFGAASVVLFWKILRTAGIAPGEALASAMIFGAAAWVAQKLLKDPLGQIFAFGQGHFHEGVGAVGDLLARDRSAHPRA